MISIILCDSTPAKFNMPLKNGGWKTPIGKGTFQDLFEGFVFLGGIS